MQEIPYQYYIDQQIQRTLGKIDFDPSPRTVYLLTKLARFVPQGKETKVLCVGCRNGHELNRFEEFGCSEVVGIDLQSSDPRIRVMDMHYLEFPESSFDIVFSSHSLEHAVDPEKACSGFERVVKPGGCIVIEVPTGYLKPASSPEESAVSIVNEEGVRKVIPVGPQGLQPDIWDFSGPDKVAAMFPSCKVLWKEVGPGKDNPDQVVIRMIFRREAQAVQQSQPAPQLAPVAAAGAQIEGLRGLIEKLTTLPKAHVPSLEPVRLKGRKPSPVESASSAEPAAIVHPVRLSQSELSPDCGNINYSQRRYFVDEFFTRRIREFPQGAAVLDMGGKKERKRGQFNIERYGFKVQYANLDRTTNPDYLCDLASIPVPSGNYDAAILAEVAEHLSAPDSVLSEAARILKRGGVLLATAPFMFRIHPDPLDIARYTPQWWEEHLRMAGFTDIEIEPQGLFFSTMADLLRDWAMFTEDRSAFLPGIREGALVALQSFREFALRMEELPETKSHPFYPSLSTGFGIRARKA